ncbi:MAG: hypothetical protein HY556_11320 [Euryarchaeota archaeon]|nr:hypothetical protein [Euryarchaeota archaeon]
MPNERRKILLMLGAIALLSVPQALGHGVHWSDVAMTGHTLFTDVEGFDQCRGAIAGIVRTKIMWFNDQVLLEFDAAGGTLYATQKNASDPRDAVLEATGVFYNFTDPNGRNWNVTEYTYEGTSNSITPPSPSSETWDEELVDTDPGVTTPGIAGAKARSQTAIFHTWVVEIKGADVDNFPGSDPHVYYNFVTIVDTCKFTKQDLAAPGGWTHPGPDATVNHNRTGPNSTYPVDPPYYTNEGHEASDGDHSHEVYEVDLWVGGTPKTKDCPQCGG